MSVVLRSTGRSIGGVANSTVGGTSATTPELLGVALGTGSGQISLNVDALNLGAGYFETSTSDVGTDASCVSAVVPLVSRVAAMPDGCSPLAHLSILR